MEKKKKKYIYIWIAVAVAVVVAVAAVTVVSATNDVKKKKKQCYVVIIRVIVSTTSAYSRRVDVTHKSCHRCHYSNCCSGFHSLYNCRFASFSSYSSSFSSLSLTKESKPKCLLLQHKPIHRFHFFLFWWSHNSYWSHIKYTCIQTWHTTHTYIHTNKPL